MLAAKPTLVPARRRSFVLVVWAAAQLGPPLAVDFPARWQARRDADRAAVALRTLHQFEGRQANRCHYPELRSDCRGFACCRQPRPRFWSDRNHRWQASSRACPTIAIRQPQIPSNRVSPLHSVGLMIRTAASSQSARPAAPACRQSPLSLHSRLPSHETQ